MGQQLITAVPSLLLAALAICILAWPTVKAISVKSVSGYRLVSLGIATSIVIIAWLGVRLIANPAVVNPSGGGVLARLVLLPAPGKVFLPLVSIAVFWGPTVVVACLNWPCISGVVRSLGGGVVAALGVSLPLALAGEPRFLTSAWPMLVVATAILLDRPYPRRFYIVFAGTSLLFAQFWLMMNIVPWQGGDLDRLQDFPKQLYFMHYGLWMGWIGYALQAVLLVIAGFALTYTQGTSTRKN